MPKPPILHSITKDNIKDGKRVLEKEKIADGDKGLTFMYLQKTDNDIYKVFGKEIEKDKFEVTVQKGDDKNATPDTYSIDKLIAMVKKDKKLAFVVDYLAKRKKSNMARSNGTAKKSKSKGKAKKSKSKGKAKNSKSNGTAKKSKSKEKAKNSKSKGKAKKSKSKGKVKKSKSKGKAKKSKSKSKQNRGVKKSKSKPEDEEKSKSKKSKSKKSKSKKSKK